MRRSVTEVSAARSGAINVRITHQFSLQDESEYTVAQFASLLAVELSMNMELVKQKGFRCWLMRSQFSSFQ